MPLEPVQFGDPTPEGRMAGDCHLCAGDVSKGDPPEPSVCDCQLRYTAEPGKVVRWTIGNEGLRDKP